MDCLRRPWWPSSTGRRRHGVSTCYRWHLQVSVLGLGRGHVDVDGVDMLDDHLSGYELLDRLVAAAIPGERNQPTGDGADFIQDGGQDSCSSVFSRWHGRGRWRPWPCRPPPGSPGRGRLSGALRAMIDGHLRLPIHRTRAIRCRRPVSCWRPSHPTGLGRITFAVRQLQAFLELDGSGENGPAVLFHVCGYRGLR